MSAELIAQFPDVDPFLLKKWEKLFNIFFDRNAGGDVDWGDFYLVVKHVRDIYGAQSEQMGYARESMKALWEGLLSIADKNQDKKIQLEEWIEVLKGTDPKHESKWFLEYLKFMYKLFDVSGDNLLDLAEYTDGMVAHGVSAHEAGECFKMFCKDKQGNPLRSIDFNQFKEMWHEYFHSTDPTARGNYLFGMNFQ